MLEHTFLLWTIKCTRDFQLCSVLTDFNVASLKRCHRCVTYRQINWNQDDGFNFSSWQALQGILYKGNLPLVPSVPLTFKPLEVKSSSLSSSQVSQTLDVIYVTLAVSSVMLTYVCPSSRNDVPPLSVLFPSARIAFAITLFFLVFPAKSGVPCSWLRRA